MMQVKPVSITALVLAVYALLSAYKPGGMMAYLAPSACWTIVALATLWASGIESPKTWFRRPIAIMAAAVAVAQIFILIDVGLFTGFGKSPISFTPMGIVINAIYVSTGLLGVELSRAYLMKSYGIKRPILTLGIITFFYANLYSSLTQLPALFNPTNLLPFVDHLGSTFLPTFTESLLASYLALLGGPIASLAYRAPLTAFQWFVPIQPELTWGFRTLLGVVPPTLGFLYVNQAVTLHDLMSVGIKVRARRPTELRRQEKAERSSLIGWTAVSVIGILMVWFSTGLLGIYPTVPISESMRPKMGVGDLVILTKIAPEKLRVGDIIQFWREGEMIMHRIHEIYKTETGTLFITKGDANNAPDTDPVFAEQIRGKVISIIPRIGWVSIYVKEAVTAVWSLLTSNLTLAYSTIAALASGATVYTIQTQRSRPKHRLRRSW